MITFYLRALYRERRRYVSSLFLLFFAGLLFASAQSEGARLTQVDLIWGAIFAAGFGLAMPVISIFAPRLRFWIEAMSLTLFAMALMGYIWPRSAFRPELSLARDLMTVMLVILVGTVLRAVIYGRWSDRFIPSGSITLVAQTTTRLSPDQLFRGLVPLPGRIDPKIDPDILSAEYIARDKRRVRVLAWTPPGEVHEAHVYLDELRPPFHVKLEVTTMRGPRDSDSMGVSTVHITETTGTCVLTIWHEMRALPPRRMLRGWLDDSLGRLVDARVASLEAAYGIGPASLRRVDGILRWQVEPADHVSPILPAGYFAGEAREAARRRESAKAASKTSTRQMPPEPGDVRDRAY